MEDLAWIRLKCPGDSDDMADAVVEAFLDEHSDLTEGDRRNLTLADCYEYLARSERWQSRSRGGVSYSNNRLLADAAKLRAQVGYAIGSSTLTHSDFEADE